MEDSYELYYVAQGAPTDEYVSQAKSELVKMINKKVSNLKNDKSLKVEYMTLYERDKEKFQEGLEQGVEKGKIEDAKKLLHGFNDEQIAEMTGLAIEVIKQLRNE